MRILVTNDDGIYSPGLAALARVATQFGDVKLVAPDVEQSSMSHAITATRPLSYRSSPVNFPGVEVYRVNGTPSDCVALGSHLWATTDVVLSGINLGYNLGTGSESVSKEDLKKMLKKTGWKISYTSTKEHWDIDPEAEILIVSGGDGTIKKAATALMDLTERPLLALLPMGTANNIANSLGIPTDPKQVIESWMKNQTRIIQFDTGVVNNGAVSDFFIEGVGFGIFPKMINEMKENASEGHATPADNLAASLEEIYNVSTDYKPVNCRLEIDGKDFSGKMLLIEIMNIRSVGPNVKFAPEVNFSDGQLDIVIATSEDRKQLEKYFRRKIIHDKDEYPLSVIKGRNIQLHWEGPDFHLDDALIEITPGSEIQISVHKNQLEFLVPINASK